MGTGKSLSFSFVTQFPHLILFSNPVSGIFFCINLLIFSGNFWFSYCEIITSFVNIFTILPIFYIPTIFWVYLMSHEFSLSLEFSDSKGKTASWGCVQSLKPLRGSLSFGDVSLPSGTSAMNTDFLFQAREKVFASPCITMDLD